MIIDSKGFKKLEENDYFSAAIIDADGAFNANFDRVSELLAENTAIVKGATAPADTNALWVDTGNKGTLRYYNGTAWVFCAAVYGV